MNRFVTILAAVTLAASPAALAQTSPPQATPGHDHQTRQPDAGGPAKPGMMMGNMGMMGRLGLAGLECSEPKPMMGKAQGMMPSNIEADIGALKSDLKITDAQMVPWERFADALRFAAKTTEAARHNMAAEGSATLPTRLARCEAILSARLSALKAVEAAVGPLYSSLGEEQKKIADGLRLGPMGMM